MRILGSVLIVLFLAYCFAGVFAFLPFLVGLISQFFKFFLDLIKYNIYPVSSMVYVVFLGLFIYLIVSFFISLFKNN